MKKQLRIFILLVIVSAVILSLVPGATATEHEHVWDIQEISGDIHIIICQICSEYRMESHTYDSTGSCSICGYEEHEHNYQCESYDSQFHTLVCTVCGYEKTTTHKKDSEGACTVCGYTPHEHIWQYNGEYYAYNHGLRCTQCAATSLEDHIYGSDGKCTVCGQEPPHEHQWEWDGNQSNYLNFHFMVCSCGATTTEDHRLLKWDGKTGNERGHGMVCGICGFGTFIFDHIFDSTYFNGERCTECGYPGQGSSEPDNKPSETTPKETKPPETKPAETSPAETEPVDTAPTETTSVETEPAETTTKETEPSGTTAEETESAENEPTDTKPTPSETVPKNTAEEEPQRSSSAWVWAAFALVVAGGLGAVVFYLKKKSS